MPERLLRGVQLRKLLCINPSTQRKWEVEYKYLVPHTHIANEPHYSHTDVNHILAEGARNFATQPTVQDLLSGKLKLVRAHQAAKLIGRSINTLPGIIRLGHLPAIKLRFEYRFALDGLIAYIDANDDPSRVSRQTASLVLGGSRWLLDQWIQNGDLIETSHPLNPHLKPVTLDSILRLLSTLLPSWINAEDWLEDRDENGEHLLTTGRAATLVGGEQLLRELMQDRKIRFLTLPGGQIRVAPESIEAYLERSTPLTTAQLANVFAATKTAIWLWRQDKELACQLHQHDDDKLYVPCLLHILERHLTSGVSAQRWLNARLHGSSPVVTLQSAAQILEVSLKEARRLAKDGDLQGLRTGTLNPRWVFLRRHVLQCRHARRSR